MRLRLRHKPPKKSQLDFYYRWYAWHPVLLDKRRLWVWLEYVDRKDIRTRTSGEFPMYKELSIDTDYTSTIESINKYTSNIFYIKIGDIFEFEGIADKFRCKEFHKDDAVYQCSKCCFEEGELYCKMVHCTANCRKIDKKNVVFVKE